MFDQLQKAVYNYNAFVNYLQLWKLEALIPTQDEFYDTSAADRFFSSVLALLISDRRSADFNDHVKVARQLTTLRFGD